METRHRNHDRERDLDRRKRNRRDRERYKDRGSDIYRERSLSHHHSRFRRSSYRRYNKLYNSFKNRAYHPRYSNSEVQKK